MDSAVVDKVEVRRSDCFDVITFSTTTIVHAELIGYNVRYVDAVTTDPKGDPVHLAGRAFLQVTLFTWSYCVNPNDTSSNPPPKDCWAPQQAFSITGGAGSAIQEVKYAGTFERHTSFGVGVSVKLPFHVDIVDDQAAGKTHILVFVAHPA